MLSQGQQQIKLDIVSIPYLPRQVDLNDVIEVKGKLSLLSEDTIQQIRDKIESITTPDTSYRFRKTDLQTNNPTNTYSIIKIENKYYAVYKGIKQDKALGYGTSGTAKLVLDLETFEWLCLKIQSESHQTPEGTIKHIPSLIRAGASIEYKMLEITGNGQNWFERQSPTKGYQFNILTKLAKGNELFVHCNNRQNRGQPDIQWLQMAIDICKTIKTLHETHQLLHCDIKTENFIYDAVTGEINIIDFGAACNAADPTLKLVGTRGFFAPEILDKRKYSKKSDIYALGVTLLELLKLGSFTDDMHFIPYVETDIKYRYNKKIKSESARREILKYMHCNMMATDPGKRPDINSVIEFLTNIQKKYLSLQARTIFIGIFNVEEYMNSSVNEKTEIIAALRKADKVVLTDTINRGSKKYIELCRMFKEDGIIIDADLHISPDETEATVSVATHMENDQSQAIYCYFHITNKPFDPQRLENHKIKTITPAKVLSEETDYLMSSSVSMTQYQTLKKNLQMEIAHMQNTKNEDLMMQAVAVAKTAIDFEERQRNKKLTYQDIYSGLIELQTQASLTHGPGGFFVKAKTPKTIEQAQAESNETWRAYAQHPA